MHRIPALVAALALSGAATAYASGAGPRKVKVVVGRTAPLDLQLPATIRVCDDPTVVRVEARADGQGFDVVGLKEGKTLCGFAESAKAQRILIEVQVYAAGIDQDVK